ncbi:MAG: peptide-methionine (R)-S-oxide reductase [Nanoarchaeota archaeon]
MKTSKSGDKKQWKEKLTANQYKILIQEGKEIQFRGAYEYDSKKKAYTCLKCGNNLFSEGKLNLVGNWPSFYDLYEKGNVKLEKDDHPGIKRVKILCAKCGSIIDYVFEDDYGKPT